MEAATPHGESGMIDTARATIAEWGFALVNNELGADDVHVWRASLDQPADVIAKLASEMVPFFGQPCCLEYKRHDHEKGTILPRRWVVARSFSLMPQFRRPARGYERLPEMLAGLHFLAFAILVLKNFAEVLA